MKSGEALQEKFSNGDITTIIYSLILPIGTMLRPK